MPANLSRWSILLLIEVSASIAGILAFSVTQTKQQCTVTTVQSFPQVISMELGVNYGNTSTNSWRRLQMPWCTTLLSAMHLAGWNLHTKNYGSLGVFILGINGVDQSTLAGTYWQWYTWQGGHWILGPVGASAATVNENEMFLWYLAPANAGPPPPP